MMLIPNSDIRMKHITVGIAGIPGSVVIIASACSLKNNILNPRSYSVRASISTARWSASIHMADVATSIPNILSFFIKALFDASIIIPDSMKPIAVTGFIDA